MSQTPDLRVPGYITGYVRRFWQARYALAIIGEDTHLPLRPPALDWDPGSQSSFSEDHRGTPSSPGRVVTLIERSFWEELGEEPTHPPERVFGAAYRIPPGNVKEVQEYLDIREINGYSIQYTSFYPSTSNAQPIERCLVYIGLPSNPQFLGRQCPQDVAEVIATSTGPSGANAEYLFMLEDSLLSLGDGGGDDYVEDLAERVRLLITGEGEKSVRSGNGKESNSSVKTQAVDNEVERVRSGRDGEAVEETEKISQL